MPDFADIILPAADFPPCPFRCLPFSLTPFDLPLSLPFGLCFSFCSRFSSAFACFSAFFMAFFSALACRRRFSALASARFFLRLFSQAAHLQQIGFR